MQHQLLLWNSFVLSSSRRSCRSWFKPNFLLDHQQRCPHYQSYNNRYNAYAQSTPPSTRYLTTLFATTVNSNIPNSTMLLLPSPPLQFSMPGAAATTFDLNDLSVRLAATEEQRQAAYDLSRRIQVALVLARQTLEVGTDADVTLATTNQTSLHVTLAQDGTEQVTTATPPLSSSSTAAVTDTAKQRLEALMQLVSSSNSDKVITTTTLTETTDTDAMATDCLITTSTTTTATNTSRRSSSSSSSRIPRLANLSNRVEDYVRYLAYRHFLQTGKLLPPSAVVAPEEHQLAETALPDAAASHDNSSSRQTILATDEEYLAAVISVTQDLQRYGLGRAIVRDVASVQAAGDLVNQILDCLLQFDFRNGALRRKYDGCKYALKALETILYELAVTGTAVAVPAVAAAAVETTVAVDDSPETKRAKHEKEQLVPIHELKALQQRMEHRDELREILIKKCRDSQKAAKQAVFALHRGDQNRAQSLLKDCLKAIQTELLPIVHEEPLLRSGSFASVLEEYVEAQMFAVWLYGSDSTATTSTVDIPSGQVLQLGDFAVELEPEEYLGGLCDLTGEIGRFAVKQGTARHVDNVKRCLQTNRNICTVLMMMERLPGGIGKKMDQVRRSVEKLERMLYELSLSEAAGGRHVQSDVEMQMEEDDV